MENATRHFSKTDDPCWQRAERITYDANATAEDVLVAFLQAGLVHLQTNVACFLLKEQSESVHQMRVAMRRLRAVLDLYKRPLAGGDANSFSKRLGSLSGALGPARDWDVFFAEVLAPVRAETHEASVALEMLTERAHRRHARAYDMVRDALARDECTALQAELGAWVDARGWRGDEGACEQAWIGEAARSFAARGLDRCRAKVLVQGQHLKTAPPTQRHKLRIAVKKFRYAADVFSPLYVERKTAPCIRNLSHLQDALGRFNDFVIAQKMMAEIIARSRGASRETLAFALGTVEGWHAHAHAQDEVALLKLWRQFKRGKCFWS